MKQKSLHVVFIHLDLGIGGAERLVVNAALSLQKLGHPVTIYTSHHDASHCFPETTGDGSLAKCVRVYGDWLPRQQLLGRATVLCAVVRMVFLSIVLLISTHPCRSPTLSRTGFPTPNLSLPRPREGLLWRRRAWGGGGAGAAVVADGVAACVPALKLGAAPVLFYCHFPDKLLCTQRAPGKRLYRWPLDLLEGRLADKVCVNSKFTAGVFNEAFPISRRLHPQKDVTGPPGPTYGCAALPAAGAILGCPHGGRSYTLLCSPFGTLPPPPPRLPPPPPPPPSGPFVSLNRYERKKNVELAVGALAAARRALPPRDFLKVRLVIAGGYDPAVQENVQYLQELKKFVEESGCTDNVVFKKNVSDEERTKLMETALATIYTPDKEHFGIVPIEAMYLGSPVIAVASGGPLESVDDGRTGLLCAPTPEDFGHAMLKLWKDPSAALEMGKAGHTRVKQTFSLQVKWL
ncbi:unnamed protein product [Heterosigma akashiwo]